MEVICLEEKAFYTLVEEVVERIKDKFQDKFKWVDAERAMELLNIKTTTLQDYRNKGKIRYSQPEKKVILYDVDSINEFLEKHAKETF